MPSGLIAYELLGVLVPPLPGLAKPWRDLKSGERREFRKQSVSFLRNAKPIYRPDGKFAIITSLRRSDAMTEQLVSWLAKHFKDQCVRFEMLDMPRTHDNLLKFKTTCINAWGVEEYYEPDPALVRELQTRCPQTTIRWSTGLQHQK